MAREPKPDPVERIRDEHARQRRAWDPRAWAYVHDVGVLLSRIMELELVAEVFEAMPTTEERRLGEEPPEYARGWRAACAFISEEVATSMTRAKLAGWDSYRMRQEVGDIIERARRRRLDA
jgi:hypothetical protein